MKKESDDMEFISKRTKRGLLLLVFLCLLIIYTPRFLAYFRESSDIKLSQVEIQKAAQLRTDYSYAQKKKKKSFSKREYKRPPRKFNPNEYSKEEWMYLGLSEKQAEVMLKITKKGIWSNEFLGRISVLPEEVFILIQDSTFYPEKSYSKTDYSKENPKKEAVRQSVELNSATEEDLISLPGIGPSFAKRIIAYRELLGGYWKKEQLLEVYNFGTDKFELISDKIEIDPKSITKLNINTCNVDQLKAHPYLNYTVANSIVKYRDQHGPYMKIEDIKKSQLISPELFEKLKAYVYL